jgi:Zn-dependent protease
VIFLEPERSAYDLKWQMFGIPVRVHPWFWLVSAIFGWSLVQIGIRFLVLWILCVFVSILIHELGHVLVGRLFGAYGHIVLYSFGGLAIGSSDLRNRWQRIAVYFAGPGAGFVLLAVVWLASQAVERKNLSPLLGSAIYFLIEINLFWGLLNLLPVWPLDGGKISRDLLEWLKPSNGVRVAYGLSALVAGVLAVNAFMVWNNGRPLIWFLNFGGPFMALMFGMLAYQSYQLMQQTPTGRRPWDDNSGDWQSGRSTWERDPDYWRR